MESQSSPSQSPTDPLVELASLRQQVAQLTHFARQQVEQQKAAQTPSAPRIDLPKIRAPALYSGAMGTACDDWVSELVQQFAYYGAKFPDDVSRISFAAAHFAGAALHWWDKLPERSTIVGWIGFLDALHKRFRPIQAAMFARQKLGKLRMTDKHKVNQYVSAFQSVLTPISDMGQADQVHHFVNGLLPFLAAKVWERHPVDLKEAIDLAVTVEAMSDFGRAAAPGLFRPGQFGSYHRSGGTAPSASTNSPMEISAMEVDSFLADTVPDPSPLFSSSSVLAKLEQMDLRLNAISGQAPFSQSKGNRHGGRIQGLTPELIAKLRKDGKCFRCKQTGHMKNECPQQKNE
jgi:hypothetical protein